MACPPISPPHCRQDQFLVEVRGHKSCCYSYLCGRFFFTVYFCWIFFTNKTLQMLNNLAFFCPNSVWVMYRAHSLLLSWRNSLSGSEHHQQLLSTVLLWCVFVFEKEKKKIPKTKQLYGFSLFSLCVQSQSYNVLQCVTSTCVRNHLWAVQPDCLWFKPMYPDSAVHSITAVHTHKQTHISILPSILDVLLFYIILFFFVLSL